MHGRVLVLGGYGNFGRLICESLGRRSDIEIIIAGRVPEKGDKYCNELKARSLSGTFSSIALDIHSNALQQTLDRIHPDIVIHTSGPFQGQDYYIPRTCIESGCHYIDLADDRRFVCDFSELDDLARLHGVLAISGASSVPGLSSVVVNNFSKEFSQIDEIDFAIVPGSNVVLGEATMKGILSCIGHPFQSWEGGAWRQRHGWLDIHRRNFGSTLGKRWLANVDIPDLELFPSHFHDVQTVRFQAGHELGIIHLSLAFMAKLSKLGLAVHWDRYSSFFYNLAQPVKKLGSDTGGMVVQISGKNREGKDHTISWRLIAKSGVGPRIPTISAIILSNRILDGMLIQTGAKPCLGMYTLDEFFDVARLWGIYEEVERSHGTLSVH